MTTERIVNRVSQPHLDAEAEKLQLEKNQDELTQAIDTILAKTEFQVPLSPSGVYVIPDHVGDTVKIIPPAEPEQKEGVPAPQVVEDLNGEQSIIGSDPVEVEGGVVHARTAEDLLASLRASVGGEDIKVFRSQVIRAFRHIGLDTKKFFGE